jgi:hypothetical protein
MSTLGSREYVQNRQGAACVLLALDPIFNRCNAAGAPSSARRGWYYWILFLLSDEGGQLRTGSWDASQRSLLQREVNMN